MIRKRCEDISTNVSMNRVAALLKHYIEFSTFAAVAFECRMIA